MAQLASTIKHQFFDDNGDPLSGGKLYTYIAGTSTLQGTYTDNTGSTPNANPIILDAAGRANIWFGAGNYKCVLYDSSDVLLWSQDNVSSSAVADDEDSGWTEHSVTDGQAATNLTGQTVDLATYSSAVYEVEILRGTTVIANGSLAIQSLNGTGRVVTGLFMAGEAHGVTFSVSQASTTVQLKAALDTGAGNGTIKLSRRLVPV